MELITVYIFDIQCYIWGRHGNQKSNI